MSFVVRHSGYNWGRGMYPSWIAVLVGFAGGGVMAAAISAFVKHGIFHPVISVRLDKNVGSYGSTPVVFSDQRVSHHVKYLRLHIENTGLSSINDCSGYITKITKSVGGIKTEPVKEVVNLGWAHHGHSNMRNIPRDAFFHMDVVSLHLLPTGRVLCPPTPFPTSLSNFFGDKATYEFEILVTADNARPHRRIPISFDFDPQSDELLFKPLNRARFPWWCVARWRPKDA